VINNEDLYDKLQNIAKSKEESGKRRYIERIDDDGNVYLVEADEYD
jgi:hypothetical protein